MSTNMDTVNLKSSFSFNHDGLSRSEQIRLHSLGVNLAESFDDVKVFGREDSTTVYAESTATVKETENTLREIVANFKDNITHLAVELSGKDDAVAWTTLYEFDKSTGVINVNSEKTFYATRVL